MSYYTHLAVTVLYYFVIEEQSYPNQSRRVSLLWCNCYKNADFIKNGFWGHLFHFHHNACIFWHSAKILAEKEMSHLLFFLQLKLLKGVLLVRKPSSYPVLVYTLHDLCPSHPCFNFKSFFTSLYSVFIPQQLLRAVESYGPQHLPFAANDSKSQNSYCD